METEIYSAPMARNGADTALQDMLEPIVRRLQATADTSKTVAIVDKLAELLSGLQPLTLHYELVTPSSPSEVAVSISKAQVSADVVSKTSTRAHDLQHAAAAAFCGPHVASLVRDPNGSETPATFNAPAEAGEARAGAEHLGWQSVPSDQAISTVVVSLRGRTHITSLYLDLGPASRQPAMIGVEVLQLHVNGAALHTSSSGEAAASASIDRPIGAELIGVLVSAACAERQSTNLVRWTKVAALAPCTLAQYPRIDVHRASVIGLRLTFVGFGPHNAGKKHGLRAAILYKQAPSPIRRSTDEGNRTHLGGGLPQRVLSGLRDIAISLAPFGSRTFEDFNKPSFSAGLRLLGSLALASGSMAICLDVFRLLADVQFSLVPGTGFPPALVHIVMSIHRGIGSLRTLDGAACRALMFPRLAVLEAPYHASTGGFVEVTSSVTVAEKSRKMEVTKGGKGGGFLFTASSGSSSDGVYATLGVGLAPGEGTLLWEAVSVKDPRAEECTCAGVAVRPVRIASYEASLDMYLLRAFNGQLYRAGTVVHSPSGEMVKFHKDDELLFELNMGSSPPVPGQPPLPGTLTVRINGSAKATTLFTGLCDRGERLYPCIQFYSSARAASIKRVWVRLAPGVSLAAVRADASDECDAQETGREVRPPGVFVPPRLDGRGTTWAPLPPPAGKDAVTLPAVCIASPLYLTDLPLNCMRVESGSLGGLVIRGRAREAADLPAHLAVPGSVPDPALTDSGTTPRSKSLVESQSVRLMSLGGEDFTVKRGFVLILPSEQQTPLPSLHLLFDPGSKSTANPAEQTFKISLLRCTFTCALHVCTNGTPTLTRKREGDKGVVAIDVLIMFLGHADETLHACKLHAKDADIITLAVPLAASAMRIICNYVYTGDMELAGLRLVIADPVIRSAPWLRIDECLNLKRQSLTSPVAQWCTAMRAWDSLWGCVSINATASSMENGGLVTRRTRPLLMPFAVECTPSGLRALARTLEWLGNALRRITDVAHVTTVYDSLECILQLVHINLRRLKLCDVDVRSLGLSYPTHEQPSAQPSCPMEDLRNALQLLQQCADVCMIDRVRAGCISDAAGQVLYSSSWLFLPSRALLSNAIKSLFGSRGQKPTSCVVELRLKWPVLTTVALASASAALKPVRGETSKKRGGAEASKGDKSRSSSGGSAGISVFPYTTGAGVAGVGHAALGPNDDHTGGAHVRLEGDNRFERLVLVLQTWAQEEGLLHATIGCYDPLVPPLPCLLNAHQAAVLQLSKSFPGTAAHFASTHMLGIPSASAATGALPSRIPRSSDGGNALTLAAEHGSLHFLVRTCSPHAFFTCILPGLMSMVSLPGHSFTFPSGLAQPYLPIEVHTRHVGMDERPQGGCILRPEAGAVGSIRVFPEVCFPQFQSEGQSLFEVVRDAAVAYSGAQKSEVVRLRAAAEACLRPDGAASGSGGVSLEQEIAGPAPPDDEEDWGGGAQSSANAYNDVFGRPLSDSHTGTDVPSSTGMSPSGSERRVLEAVLGLANAPEYASHAASPTGTTAASGAPSLGSAPLSPAPIPVAVPAGGAALAAALHAALYSPTRLTRLRQATARVAQADDGDDDEEDDGSGSEIDEEEDDLSSSEADEEEDDEGDQDEFDDEGESNEDDEEGEEYSQM